MADELRISLTLGIHPHILTKNKPDMEFRNLERKLEEHHENVGIGKISIDHTTRCKCTAFHNKARCREEKIETQCQFLRLALYLAKRLDNVIIGFMSVVMIKTNISRLLRILLRSSFSNLPNCFFSLSSKSL